MTEDVNKAQDLQAADSKDKFARWIFDWFKEMLPMFVGVVVVFTMFFGGNTVDGISMLPTLHHRDVLLLSKFMYTPQRGDVVVVHNPGDLKINVVKRIIAVGGDTLHIDFAKGEVFVNDVKVDESYINEPGAPFFIKADWDFPSIIPADQVFVMGDNRNHSQDSRSKHVKLVKNEDVLGKVVFLLFPFDRIGNPY